MATSINEKAKSAIAKKDASPDPRRETLVGYNSEALSTLLDRYRLQISQALPQHVSAERIIQLATTVFTKNPELRKCSVPSVVGAVMNASMLGMDLTPQLGHAYFVPYWNSDLKVFECEFQVGYKGWLHLMRRTQEIKTIRARVVREGDDFQVEYGLDEKLIHRPNLKERGELVAVYAVVETKDGGYYFVVLSPQDIEARKKRNRAVANGKTTAWDTDPEAMWCKSAIRAIVPWVPTSVDVAKAAVTDGSVVTSDMFSTTTKDVDLSKVRRTEEPEDIEPLAPDGEKEPDAEPEQKKEAAEGDGGKRKKEGAKSAQAEAEPKEKQEGAKSAQGSAREQWLEKAGAQKERIIRSAGKDAYWQVLGNLGYESIAEIPEKDRNIVFEALKARADLAEKSAPKSSVAPETGNLGL